MPDLQNDRAIVTAAVQENGMALEFASAELQADSEIVQLAVKQSPRAFVWAADGLRKSKEFVSVAFTPRKALDFAHDDLRRAAGLWTARKRRRSPVPAAKRLRETEYDSEAESLQDKLGCM